MQRHAALVCVVLLLFAPTAAADPSAGLQTVLDDFLAENPAAPGVVAHVRCPALGLDWTGAAGHPARGATAPLTPRHTFRIASNTKTYVAAAVLRLVEDGRLDLDAPLAALLEPAHAAPLVADGYDLEAITLRHVLGHTAGLADHTGDDSYGEDVIARPQHRWTREEQLERLVGRFDPLGPPGERHEYSDSGYILLGAIVERATGRGLGAAVRELLDYARLGLEATWWEYEEPPPAGAGPRAHQYIGEHDSVDWHASFDLYGGGGLVTDARDLGLFLAALLEGRVLRQPATLRAMTGDGTADYRLGLMCRELDGRLVWGHTGFWNTFAFHAPSLGATVAGSVLSRDAARGQVLAERLFAAVGRAQGGSAGR